MTKVVLHQYDKAVTKSALSEMKAPLPDEQCAQIQQSLRLELIQLSKRALWLGAALLGTLLTVRFWHATAPEAWRWLTAGDIQSIDKMLFSSAFGGVVLSYLKDIVLGARKQTLHQSD